MPVKSDSERLAVVETKIDALIESQAAMTAKMDALLANYVHRSEYEKEIAEIKTEIERSRQRSALMTWITGTLAALFGVVMTILVQHYFKG